MATCTEKSTMLEDIEPRLSLSSFNQAVDDEVNNEVSFRQAFLNVFKKPTGVAGEVVNNPHFKHIVTNLSEKKSGIDISLKTKGHAFNGHFVLEGTAPRPATVTVSSTKSNIVCTFPEHAERQVVHMNASSIHGSVQVGFPRDFDGYIVLQTLVGHVSRNKALKLNCQKVVGFETPANLSASVYRVQPASSPRLSEKEGGKCADPSETHMCCVTSSHGRVKIGYADDTKIFSGAGSKTASECTVS